MKEKQPTSIIDQHSWMVTQNVDVLIYLHKMYFRSNENIFKHNKIKSSCLTCFTLFVLHVFKRYIEFPTYCLTNHHLEISYIILPS